MTARRLIDQWGRHVSRVQLRERVTFLGWLVNLPGWAALTDDERIADTLALLGWYLALLGDE